MKTKPVEPCKVCHKKTAEECSHVDCPNRKRVTAALPDNCATLDDYDDVLGSYYRDTFKDK